MRRDPATPESQITTPPPLPPLHAYRHALRSTQSARTLSSHTARGGGDGDDGDGDGEDSDSDSDTNTDTNTDTIGTAWTVAHKNA